MMKSAFVLALLMSASPAAGQAYITGHAGLAIPNDPDLHMTKTDLHVELDDGGVYGGAIGYKHKALRFEVEASQARASVSRISDARQSFLYQRGSQLRQTVMANAYLDLRMSKAVTFYVGGGAGIARMKMRATKVDSECREPIAWRIVSNAPNDREGVDGGTCKDQGDSGNTGFAYQGMAGFNFDAWHGIGIGPQFRYVTATGIRTAGKSLRPREVTFTTDKSYHAAQAMIAITKAF